MSDLITFEKRMIHTSQCACVGILVYMYKTLRSESLVRDTKSLHDSNYLPTKPFHSWKQRFFNNYQFHEELLMFRISRLLVLEDNN